MAVIWVAAAFGSSQTRLPILLWPLATTRRFLWESGYSLDIFSSQQRRGERPSRRLVSETLRQACRFFSNHLSAQPGHQVAFPTRLNTKLTWAICINLPAKKKNKCFFFHLFRKKKQGSACKCAKLRNFKTFLNTKQPGGDKNAWWCFSRTCDKSVGWG